MSHKTVSVDENPSSIELPCHLPQTSTTHNNNTIITIINKTMNQNNATFEAVDEFLDVIGSDWDSSLPFVVIFTQYSDGDIAVEKSRLDRRGATQKSTADSM